MVQSVGLCNDGLDSRGQQLDVIIWTMPTVQYSVVPFRNKDFEDSLGLRSTDKAPGLWHYSPIWNQYQYETAGNNVRASVQNITVQTRQLRRFDYEYIAGENLTGLVEPQRLTLSTSPTRFMIFYQYGFQEEQGNFQLENYESGGKEDDYILVNVQAKGNCGGTLGHRLMDGHP
ncbi:hypothetical protein BC829DRAFT_114236 [Chytridium lagenaria]|nr:hypothetical protein BC829DRAFT_114236 [Chytridium lagenaria]